MTNTFFNAAVEAIQNEEDELNKLFAVNKPYYEKQHHGVRILCEKTFVYLIFKELLKRHYPFTICPEYPYPSDTSLHSDLALLDKNGKLDSLIEFKIWTENNDKEIKNDVEKLQKEKDCKKYIFVIGFGGEIEENDSFLQRDNKLNLINKTSLKTKYLKGNPEKNMDNELNLFMYHII